MNEFLRWRNRHVSDECTVAFALYAQYERLMFEYQRKKNSRTMKKALEARNLYVDHLAICRDCFVIRLVKMDTVKDYPLDEEYYKSSHDYATSIGECPRCNSDKTTLIHTGERQPARWRYKCNTCGLDYDAIVGIIGFDVIGSDGKVNKYIERNMK